MTGQATMAEALRASIWRGGAQGRFVEYEVPRLASQTVLDVVTQVQREIDPTLAYRFACRVGMCGSCAMSVNGIARWTCRTQVCGVAPDGRLEIAPIAHLPVLKDLVTDMRSFFDKATAARGYFTGAASRQDPFALVRPDSSRRREADAAIECIGCGVCYASCEVVAWREDYLGPAALNRAWTLMNDERDVAGAQRLRAVAGAAGCHACHTHTACSERCPKGISPTAGIAGLKRLAAAAAWKGLL